jgi:hypothetical protein
MSPAATRSGPCLGGLREGLASLSSGSSASRACVRGDRDARAPPTKEKNERRRKKCTRFNRGRAPTPHLTARARSSPPPPTPPAMSVTFDADLFGRRLNRLYEAWKVCVREDWGREGRPARIKKRARDRFRAGLPLPPAARPPTHSPLNAPAHHSHSHLQITHTHAHTHAHSHSPSPPPPPSKHRQTRPPGHPQTRLPSRSAPRSRKTGTARRRPCTYGCSRTSCQVSRGWMCGT